VAAGRRLSGTIDEEPGMTHPICTTCGTQYDEAPAAPAPCPVCADERQFVGWNGQTWTTRAALAERHTLRLEDDDGLLGVGLAPAFAINQRALHLPTGAGNVLWECVSLVTDTAVAALKARGGVDWIVISHPHFFTSMADWSEAMGGVPILLHEANREWVRRPSDCIQFWSGEEHRLSDAVTLVRVGGHFPGSTVLHWRDGPRPGGALFPGDTPSVVMDRRHVTFMYSYPNYWPMRPSEVRRIRSCLQGYAFDDVFGFTWGRNIIGDARRAVDASFDRYLTSVAT
jgi:hypothetical protein